MAGLLRVRDVMSSPVRTITPDASVLEAVRKMNKFGVGCVVVMEGERAKGILTERDVMSKVVEPLVEPTSVKVKEVMSTPLLTVSEDLPVEEAARLMCSKRLKKLPVVREGRLVGIVTQTNLCRSEPRLIGLLEELLRKT